MKQQVEKLVAAHFGLGKVHEDDDLISDLNGDALDVIELVMELEEVFNIQISDDEAEHLRTVYDVCRCVEQKLDKHVTI
jgi:acyl carrier protein